MSQNIIQIGVDTASFTPQKKKVLEEYLSIFERLEKYDGAKFSPVGGDSLVAFNQSISNTNKLLEELNTKLVNVKTNTNLSGNSSKSAAKSSTELGLAVKEYNKQASDAAKISAKLSSLTSDQAKETAALKIQLSEVTKAILDEAKASNSFVQAREAEKRATQSAKQSLKEETAARKESTRVEKEAARQSLADAREVARQKLNDKKAEEYLNNDYKKLKDKLEEQRLEYARAHTRNGADSPEATRALSDYASTAGIVESIDNRLNNASRSSGSLSRGLGTAFSYLRNIAYILPGIGIAGIFNLAFEAIAKAVEEMGFFNDKIKEQLSLDGKINDSLRDQYAIYSDILDQAEKITQLEMLDSSYNLSKKLSVDESRGKDARTIVDEKLNLSQFKFAESDLKIRDEFNYKYKTGEATTEKLFENAKQVVKDEILLNNQIKEINNIINKREQRKIGTEEDEKVNKELSYAQRATLAAFKISVDFFGGASSKEELDERLKLRKSQLESDKLANKVLLGIAEDFINSKNELDKAQAEKERFESDQARNIFVENNKKRLNDLIQTNQAIIASNRSSEKEQLDAAEKIKEAHLEINDLTRINTTGVLEKDNARYGVPVNVNLNATNEDIKKADVTQKFNNKETERNFTKQVDDTQTSFYQRLIKNNKDIKKSLLESEARYNETIANNENVSLDKRLKAYSLYLLKKQQIQSLELVVLNQEGASSFSGKTSLTKEDRVKNEKETESQILNIQADAKEKVYNIVSTSLKKQLDEINDFNKNRLNYQKEEEAKELNILTDKFEDGIISYKRYSKEIKRIQKEYKTDAIGSEIINDRLDIARLKENEKQLSYRSKKSNERVEGAFIQVQYDKSEGNNTVDSKKEYDIAVGENKAIDDAILENQNSLSKAKRKLVDDDLAYAKSRIVIEKQLYQYLYQQVLSYVKKAIDEEYAAREKLVEYRKNQIDQSIDSEKEAIDRSTLLAKDKTALDINLSQQKIENDKNSAREERRLKHDNAIYDRDIALAEITIRTAVGVINAISHENYAGAITAGIEGGIQSGAVASTKIPGYEFGTGPNGTPRDEYARTGEKGKEELVIEPYKSPYLVNKENVSFLPKGTHVIPLRNPDFNEKINDESWSQTKWLAKQIKSSVSKEKEVKKNVFKLNLGNEIYKRKILGY